MTKHEKDTNFLLEQQPGTSKLLDLLVLQREGTLCNLRTRVGSLKVATER